MQDELVAVVHVNSKLNIQEEITPAELPNIPLVLRERGSGTLDVFERALSQHNLKLSSLNVLMYLGGTESIKLFLEHTDCMGIVSIRSVHKELVAGTLRVVEIKGCQCCANLILCSYKGRREDYLKFLCALRGIIARTCRSDFFHTNHLPTAELYYDAVKLRALA